MKVNRRILRYLAAVTCILTLAILPGLGCGQKPAEEAPTRATSQPVAARVEGRTLPGANLATAPAPVRRLMQIVRDAAAKGPFKAEYAEELGALYFIHGFTPQAIKCFTIVTETDPRSLFGWYFLGLAQEKEGDGAGAIAAMERAVQVAPNHAPALIRLAILQQNDFPDKSAANYRLALKLDASLAIAHYGIGQIEAAEGRHAEAVTSFQTALALFPRYESAHRALAQSLIALGREEEAAQHANVEGAAPMMEDPAYLKLMRWGLDSTIMVSDALQAAQQRKFDEAEKLLRDAVEIDKTVSARIAYGALRMMQERVEDAAEQFRLATEQDPDSAEARRNLGAALVHLRRLEEAEQIFRGLLARDDKDYVSTVRLATLLAQLKREDESITLYERAKELAPDHPLLHLEYAAALLGFGKNEPALAEVRRHLEITPNDPTALQMLGRLLLATGDASGARDAYERSLSIQPRQLEPYRVLVELAMKEKDVPRARELLSKGLASMPRAAPLANLLGWILATTPDKSVANPREALQWAELACRITSYKHHEYLDTLAAASASMEQFDDAVRWQKEAIRIGTEAGVPDLDAYQQRLALYEQKKPFVDSQ